MGTESGSSRRGPGRPAEFDRAAVLERLVWLFWTNGYESTSLSDIVATSGLSKSSLYNAFGSKDELFHEVLARYVETDADAFAAWIAGGDSLERLHSVVDEHAARLVRSDRPRGCLAMISSLERWRDPSVVALCLRHRTARHEGLRQVLSDAAVQGEVEPRRVDERSESLLALLLSSEMAWRARAQTTEVDAIARAAHSTIEDARRRHALPGAAAAPATAVERVADQLRPRPPTPEPRSPR